MAHWRIFAEHINVDKREKEEQLRDLAEYAMAFHNYDAVQAVQAERDRQEHSRQHDEAEDIYLQQLKDMGINLDRDSMYQAREEYEESEEFESVPKQSRYGVGNFEEEPHHRSARARIQEDIIKVTRTPKKE